MDKKILDALNNVSIAIEHLVDSLNDKNKSNNDIISSIKSSDISDGLNKIHKSVLNVKRDTEMILKNQKSSSKNVVDSKKDDKSSFFSNVISKDSISSIRSGVGTIVLIAAGILAIGSAFSIVGSVDFSSVLSLSIALPLIAIAFEKISNMKGLSGRGIIGALFITMGMSASIFIMSKILSNVDVIDSSRLTSIIALSAALSLIGIGISGLSKSISDIKNPIGLSIMLPLFMIGVSTAISISSYMLSDVRNITPNQFLTSLAISLIFIPIAFSMKFISNAIKDVNYGKILMIPIVMSLMSYSIALSSKILSTVNPIDGSLLWNIVLQSLTLSIVAISLSFSIYVMDKMGITPIKSLMSGLSLIIISGSIALSSKLLSFGDYSNYPSIEWSISFSLSMLMLSIPVAILGSISLPIVAMGAVGLVLVAAAITAASYILSYMDPKFLYNIADAIGYFMNVVSNSLSYGLKVIAPALKVFISTVGKEIIGFAKNILPIIVNAVGDLFDRVLKPLGEFIKTVLPPLGTFLSTIITSMIPMIQIIINHFSNMFETIQNIFLSVSTIISSVSKGIVMIISSIGNSVSNVIDVIGNKIEGVLDKISKIMNSASGFIDSIGNNIEKTINSIVGGVERLSKVGTLDLATSSVKIVTFLSTIAKGVSTFLSTPVDINKMNSYSNFFKNISSIFSVFNNMNLVNGVDPFTKLSNGVDKLSKSLISLNGAIDVDKLYALKSLSSSVVVMSMIDPDQFDKFMVKLSDNSSTFGRVINDVVDGNVGYNTVKTSQSFNNTSNDDRILEVLESMNIKLSNISNDISSVSLYLNNLDNNINIKPN